MKGKKSNWYCSPGSGSQGKVSGRQNFYMSPGKGGQKAVGKARNTFGTSGRTTNTVKG